jgi:hypothetical protein
VNATPTLEELHARVKRFEARQSQIRMFLAWTAGLGVYMSLARGVPPTPNPGPITNFVLNVYPVLGGMAAAFAIWKIGSRVR